MSIGCKNIFKASHSLPLKKKKKNILVVKEQEEQDVTSLSLVESCFSSKVLSLKSFLVFTKKKRKKGKKGKKEKHQQNTWLSADCFASTSLSI